MTLTNDVTVERTDSFVSSKDHTTLVVAVGAAIISITAYLYFQHMGLVMGYKDSVSHMQIAERVVNSPTPGFGQIGGVWLPFMHLLMVPLVWISGMYYSGFAGSIISMVSFVIAVVFLYKITFSLADNRWAGLVAAVIFAANPSILYLQTTPMTELLFFACVIVATYNTQRWIQEHQLHHLVGAGILCLLATLTRYEAWVISGLLVTIIVAFALIRRGREYADGTLILCCALAFSGIIGWFGWNLIIFRNPFNFVSGDYARSSLFQDSSDPSIGNWDMALRTYWHAAISDVGAINLLMTVIGILLLAFYRRKADSLPVLSNALLVPFFVFMTESGRSPLQVMETSGNMYNLRFGLVIMLVSPVVIGYTVTTFRMQYIRIIVALAALMAIGSLYSPQGVSDTPTAKEAAMNLESDGFKEASSVAVFLKGNYTGGRVLMESFANELVPFYAHISLSEIVYEGSDKLWEPALADPADNKIDWIIMRKGSSPDKVYRMLNGSPQMNKYDLVFHNDTYSVYKKEPT